MSPTPMRPAAAVIIVSSRFGRCTRRLLAGVATPFDCDCSCAERSSHSPPFAAAAGGVAYQTGTCPVARAVALVATLSSRSLDSRNGAALLRRAGSERNWRDIGRFGIVSTP